MRRTKKSKAPEDQASISPETIRTLGQTIGGTNWGAALARAVNYSKSMISRVSISDEAPSYRPCDPKMAYAFRNLIVDRMEILNSLLTAEHMPGGTTLKTREAQRMIKEAIKLLHKSGPKLYKQG